MGGVRYYWLVLGVACRSALSLAQSILFIAIILSGTAALVLPRFGMTADFAAILKVLSGWQITAVTFGSIILIRLLLAPYWIWRDQRDELIRLRAGPDAHTLAIQNHTRAIDEQNQLQRLQANPVQSALRQHVESASTTSQFAVSISLPEHDAHGMEESLPDGQVRSWIYVVIRNLRETPIPNITVYQERAVRGEFKGGGILPVLEKPLSLAPLSQTCVRIAYRDEKPLDNWKLRWEGGQIIWCCPRSYGEQKGQRQAMLRIRVRATGLLPSPEITIHLDFDAHGRLVAELA